jgi:hypothetical protein
MKKRAMLAIVPALVAGAVLASPDRPVDPAVPAAQWLPLSEVARKFEDMGYMVREVEADDGTYEVKGRDANGVKFEAYVHPATGEILKREQDD